MSVVLCWVPAFAGTSGDGVALTPLRAPWLVLARSQIGGNDLLILQHASAGPARQRAPVIEHMDTVGEVGDHLHIMLNPDHGNTELVLDAQNETREVLALLAVQAGRRLVEQQDGWLVGQGAREADDLLGAEWQAADGGVAIALQFDESIIFSTASRWRISSPAHRGQKQHLRERIALDARVAAGQQVVDHAHLREQFAVLEGARRASAAM